MCRTQGGVTAVGGGSVCIVCSPVRRGVGRVYIGPTGQPTGMNIFGWRRSKTPRYSAAAHGDVSSHKKHL